MIDFTEGQKKTIANALTALSLTTVFAFVALIAYGVLKLFSIASTALIPVIIGFFLALFFKPYYELWVKLVKNPTLALVIMLASVFVPITLIIWYAGAVILDQIINLIHQAPHLFAEVIAWFKATFPRLNDLLIESGYSYDTLGDIFSQYGGTALKAGTSALKALSGIASVLVALLFFVIFTMSMPRQGSEIANELTFIKDDTRKFIGEQLDVFVDILVSFFQRQTVICLIEGLMYGTGFALVGLPYGFLIGFALGVLNLIPFCGTVICLPVALPIAYFAHGGSLTRLLLVLSVWLLGQFLDGYFITPKIQGNKTGLGYAGVIFSFFFWATILGPLLGMLLAIPLSAFCVVLWRAVKAKYLK